MNRITTFAQNRVSHPASQRKVSSAENSTKDTLALGQPLAPQPSSATGRGRGPQYPFALDAAGKLVTADLANPKERYRCLECGGKIFPRGGRRWGNRFVVDHFAHVGRMGECSGESVPHQATVYAILEGIAGAQQSDRPYLVAWSCDVCGATNSLNLAVVSSSIVKEKMRDAIRPDLMILGRQDQSLAAIEVIWTHPLSRQTEEIYTRLRIPLIRVQATLEGIAELRTGIPANLARVQFAACVGGGHRPPLSESTFCEECKRPLQLAKLQAWSGYRCSQCRKLVPILDAFVLDASRMDAFVSDAQGHWCRLGLRPRNFWKPASEMGVKMDERYSSSERRRYVMHLCPHCNAKLEDSSIQIESSTWTRVPPQPIRIGYFRHGSLLNRNTFTIS